MLMIVKLVTGGSSSASCSICETDADSVAVTGVVAEALCSDCAEKAARLMKSGLSWNEIGGILESERIDEICDGEPADLSDDEDALASAGHGMDESYMGGLDSDLMGEY